MTAAELIARFDVREVHSIAVDAPPEAAVAAALAVTPAEAPLLRRLLRLRGMRAAADVPVWQALQRAGFLAVDEATLAAVVRPWRPSGAIRLSNRLVQAPRTAAGERKPDGPGDKVSQSRLRAFADPGWAVVALDFRAEAGRLVTETRVRCTDAAARRRFRAYWLAVRPFSGLVRRSWLAAAKRRAERD